jgi:hypothetical protein
MVMIFANYRYHALAKTWSAEVYRAESVDDLDPEVLCWIGKCATARAAFDAVLGALNDLPARVGIEQTRHALAGDPWAWMDLAEREGFSDLVQ